VQRWPRGTAADPIEAVHGEDQSLRQNPTILAISKPQPFQRSPMGVEHDFAD
jgi:hypothetical protein